MQLKDIANMEEFLENNCYCPGEIYDMTGFFYQVFSPDTECKLFCEGCCGSIHGKFVIAKAEEEYNPQIIYIEITDDKVDSLLRIDATENNMTQIKGFMNGTFNTMHLNEFPESRTAESLEEIFKMADAILVD